MKKSIPLFIALSTILIVTPSLLCTDNQNCNNANENDFYIVVNNQEKKIDPNKDSNIIEKIFEEGYYASSLETKDNYCIYSFSPLKQTEQSKTILLKVPQKKQNLYLQSFVWPSQHGRHYIKVGKSDFQEIRPDINNNLYLTHVIQNAIKGYTEFSYNLSDKDSNAFIFCFKYKDKEPIHIKVPGNLCASFQTYVIENKDVIEEAFKENTVTVKTLEERNEKLLEKQEKESKEKEKLEKKRVEKEEKEKKRIQEELEIKKKLDEERIKNEQETKKKIEENNEPLKKDEKEKPTPQSFFSKHRIGTIGTFSAVGLATAFATSLIVIHFVAKKDTSTMAPGYWRSLVEKAKILDAQIKNNKTTITVISVITFAALVGGSLFADARYNKQEIK